MITPPGIPSLATERLTLRGPENRDFDAVADFFADADRAWGFGGQLDRPEAWRWFASLVGHWHLKGFGFWMVDDAAGETQGFVGIWEPEGWPEPELGWVLYPNGEGKGYAFEAAVAARNYAIETLKLPSLISSIFVGNDRSIRLAERLGAVPEGSYENVTHGEALLYRHPIPEVLEA